VPPQRWLQGTHPFVLLHKCASAGRPCLTQLPPQIIISTGISYGVNLNSKFGISVVGNIPSG